MRKGDSMMGFGEVLQDPVYQTYVGIVGGALLAVGLLLLVMKHLAGKNVDSVWRTYRSWLVMAPLVFVAMAGGRIVLILAIGALSLMGFKEFSRATGLYHDWYMTGAVYFGIACLIAVCLATDPREQTPGWYGLFMVLPVYIVGLILFMPILRNQYQGQLQGIALAILGFIYLGWMFTHLAFLVNSPHATGYLLYLVFAVGLSDISAFTFGKLYGRHPLRNQISPNKTWQGSLGALGVSMALPWLLHGSFPHFGPFQLVLTGMIVGIGGQLGDLSISTIKRDLAIKDMGSVIPGHGGVLDRVDSLIFVSPIFLHMIRWFYDLH